jgi:hypothetical protein
MDRFRRDFETVEEYRRRLAEQDQAEPVEDAEPVAELPSPWVVDLGPRFNTPADERAIRAENQRIFELDERDRIRR